MFLTVQGFSQAHATSNGGVDHTHDGVICDVSLAAAEQVVLTPPQPNLTPFKPVSEANWEIVLDNEYPRAFDGRAPPPRGPPAH